MFDKFRKSSNKCNIDNFDFVKQIDSAIQCDAFLWFSFFNHIDLKKQHLIESDFTFNFNRHVAIIAIFCHKIRFIKINKFQTILKFDMYHNEIRRRMLNTFCYLNLMMLQTILTKRIKKLIKKTKRKVKTSDKQFVEIVTYDNFVFMKKRREKRIDEFRKMRFIITSLIFDNRDFSENSLKQNMWWSVVYSLSIVTIVKKLNIKKIDQKNKHDLTV